MRTFPYHQVDVFADRALEGNPLAVFTQPEGLTDCEMQAVALEMSVAETVFVLPAVTAESIARLRIFTPTRELAFAGHPTVGAVATILLERPDAPAAFAVDEGVGPVPIRVERPRNARPVVWLTTPAVEFGATVPRVEAARIVGLAEDDLGDAEPCYASAGSPFLFVGVRRREAVDRAVYASGTMPAQACADAIGVFVFTTAHEHPEGEHAVYARMFAPWSGIPEDPATGGATGPLAAYLLREKMLASDRNVQFVSEQGTKMGRRSFLRVRVTHRGDAPPAIEIGGSVVPFAKGMLALGDVPAA